MKHRGMVVVIVLIAIAIILAILIHFATTFLEARDLSILGLLIDMGASIILVIPMLKSLQEMGKESLTVNGFNVHLMNSMKRDRIFTIIGLFVLAMGFTFQLFAFLKS